MTRSLVATLLGMTLFFAMPALANDPLVLPEPIKFPQFVDSVRVSEAIMTALTNRRWLVEADTGESIRARFVVRRHVLRIRLDYTPRGITFHYVDSTNLDYEEEDGAKLIHGNANKWLARLATEVHLQVQRLFFPSDPTQVVPAEPPPS